MAQKYIVELLDDLDGTPATDTINFALDGTSYVIDLNDAHIDELRGALEPFVGAARRADRDARPVKQAIASTSNKRSDLGAVREWANANGHKVSGRGRVSQTILDAYDAR